MQMVKVVSAAVWFHPTYTMTEGHINNIQYVHT